MGGVFEGIIEGIDTSRPLREYRHEMSVRKYNIFNSTIVHSNSTSVSRP